MSSKNRLGGLGRGLGALIPTAPSVAARSFDDRTDDGPDRPHAAERSEDAGDGPGQVPSPAQSTDATVQSTDATVQSTDPSAHSTGPSAQSTDEPGEHSLLPVTGATFAELPIVQIHSNAKQPRQVFDEDSLAELTHSVREFGVLQPIVVRADADGYELVMGERRLRAAAAAGMTEIPAIVRSTADDAMLRDALLENIHRAQLNPLEEAAAYQQLLEEFGTTHEELAHRIGCSRPQITNMIRLLNLPIPVQRRVAAGVISAGHARALLGLDDGDMQDELATRIVAEGLSVRATEELVSLHASGHAQKKATRRSPAHRITAPAVTELADKLSDAFDTRVRVELGRRKGKITVEFASVDDLERIVAVMAPQLATRHADEAQLDSLDSNEP